VTISDAKQALRVSARARRRVAHESGATQAAYALIRLFQRHVTVAPDAVVSGYWPAGSEFDVRPLMGDLVQRGHTVALPVVVARDAPLAFRAWRPGDPLVKGNGAMVPSESASLCEPDLLLVPLVGFDRSLVRLGQGGGYYDRTLPALRAARPIVALGIAYAVQELPSIPTAPYDQKLDAVLTETGVIEAR
jgi:5-formyltetrahydrofolate cyclo-ligase